MHFKKFWLIDKGLGMSLWTVIYWFEIWSLFASKQWPWDPYYEIYGGTLRDGLWDGWQSVINKGKGNWI